MALRKASAVYVPSESQDMRMKGTAKLEDVGGSALETYARAICSEPGVEFLAERRFS